MVFLLRNLLVLSWSFSVWVQGDVSVDCGKSSVSVRWAESPSLIDPWFLHLGDCLPSSISVRPGGAEAIFHARFDDCSFRRLVTMDEITFENELSSKASSRKSSDFTSPVVCVYERPAEWRPPAYDPVHLHAKGQGDLVFHMNFMKADFSDVATSTTFSLGSLIPIAAAVEQQAHQPLVLLLEECVASSTPEMAQDGDVYPIIANKGCLLDSKKANSRFLPRHSPSEIRLYLQAFKFANGEQIYIHCKLVAWDPEDMDSGRKACHYDKRNGRQVGASGQPFGQRPLRLLRHKVPSQDEKGIPKSYSSAGLSRATYHRGLSGGAWLMDLTRIGTAEPSEVVLGVLVVEAYVKQEGFLIPLYTLWVPLVQEV